MTTTLITGKGGTPHITSGDMGAMQSGIIGNGSYLLQGSDGTFPTVTMQDANHALIPVLNLVVEGRYARVTEAETATIESGVSGTVSIASARSPASRAQERLAGSSHGPIRQLSARRVRGPSLLFSTSRKTVSRGAPSAPGVEEQPVAATLTPYTAVCGLSAEAAAASGTSMHRSNRIAVSFFIRVKITSR